MPRIAPAEDIAVTGLRRAGSAISGAAGHPGRVKPRRRLRGPRIGIASVGRNVVGSGPGGRGGKANSAEYDGQDAPHRDGLQPDDSF
jgi:hypothetical protein